MICGPVKNRVDTTLLSGRVPEALDKKIGAGDVVNDAGDSVTSAMVDTSDTTTYSEISSVGTLREPLPRQGIMDKDLEHESFTEPTPSCLCPLVLA